MTRHHSPGVARPQSVVRHPLVRHPVACFGLTALAALAAGCATTPKDDPALDAARSALNAAAEDPLAQSAAAVTLQKGQLALSNGQAALDHHQPLTIVEHFAYLAQRDAETAEAQIGEARARSSIDQASAERNQIIADARAREASQARAQAQSAEMRAAQLQQQLQQEMAQLEARQTDRGYVLSLGDVLFDTGQATLKPGAQVALSRLARFLTTHRDERVEIDGNTDNTGSPELNRQLSQARADAVRDALLQQGVPDERIVTRGLGESMPVATNATAAGRQQNRRVDVVFINGNGGSGADAAHGSVAGGAMPDSGYNPSR